MKYLVRLQYDEEGTIVSRERSQVADAATTRRRFASALCKQDAPARNAALPQRRRHVVVDNMPVQHPSWTAKRRQQAALAVRACGKRRVFEDDGNVTTSDADKGRGLEGRWKRRRPVGRAAVSRAPVKRCGSPRKSQPASLSVPGHHSAQTDSSKHGRGSGDRSRKPGDGQGRSASTSSNAVRNPCKFHQGHSLHAPGSSSRAVLARTGGGSGCVVPTANMARVEVHPSWRAAQQRKLAEQAMQRAALASEGPKSCKIVFD